MTEPRLRVVSTQQLRKIVRRSDKAGLSNLPNDLFWSEIDPNGKHVLNVMPHRGEFRFVRTFAMCKTKSGTGPAELWIDVTADDWERLPKEAHG